VRLHPVWAAIASLGLLVGLVLLAFAVGRYPVSLGELVAVLRAAYLGGPDTASPSASVVVLNVRGPRILAALLVGAALAAAGTAYQSLFRNPLVSPDILGVSSGAALGASIGIFLSWDLLGIQILALVFGLGAVAAVYGLAAAVRGHDPVLVLVLAGVAIGALLGAVIALIKYLADPYNQLPAITFWLLGSLAATNPQDVRSVAAPVVVGIAVLWLMRWRINLMTLGDEEAKALGVGTGRIRLVTIAAATAMTAAVVSISGIVGWVGLLIPHVARFLVGPSFARLLPTAVLLGAAFMIGTDTLARTLARIEVPLGVLSAFVGTPAFIWLLASTRRGWQ